MKTDPANWQSPGIATSELRRALPSIILSRAGAEVPNSHPLASEIGDRCSLRDLAAWASDMKFDPADGPAMNRALNRGISSVVFSEGLEATGRELIKQTVRQAERIDLICRPLPQKNLQPVTRSRVNVIGQRDGEHMQNGEAPMMYAVIDQQQHRHLARYMDALYITRESVINDDPHVIAEVFREAGRQCAAREWRTVLGLLESNPEAPPMDGDGGDARPFFSVADGNEIESVSPPNLTGLSAAVAALRRQKGADGRPMNLRPARLIVPAEHEIQARQNLKDADLSDLTVISTTELESSWYLMANPRQFAAIGLGYLGTPGSQVQTWSLERVPRLPAVFSEGLGYHLHQSMRPMLLSRRGIVRVELS